MKQKIHIFNVRVQDLKFASNPSEIYIKQLQLSCYAVIISLVYHQYHKWDVGMIATSSCEILMIVIILCYKVSIQFFGSHGSPP